MTKEQTKEAAKVMLAWAEGKDVECRIKGCSSWVPFENEDEFDFIHCYYRIKPETKYRPFKSADEVMDAIDKHGDWVIDGNTYRRIDKVTDLGGGVAITLSGCKEWGVNELPRIEHLSFMDGTPFGILED